MREASLLSLARRRIEEIFEPGKIRWIDEIANIELGKQRVKLLIEAKAGPSEANLEAYWPLVEHRRKERKADIAVIVVPHFSPEARARLKQQRINYLDASGNAWIRHEGILINQEVPKNLYPHQSKDRKIFADKASIILRYLLEQPDYSGRVRRIAEQCDLDPGYVSKMLSVVVDSGYAVRHEEGSVELRERERLVLEWLHSYNWRKNEIRGFYCSPEVQEHFMASLKFGQEPWKGQWALSMHAGANLYEPVARYEPIHLYVRGIEMEQHLIKHFRLVPGEKAGNIFLMKPYYEHSALWGVRKRKGYAVVSDLQLYLDLYHFPIRGREAADAIWQKRLAKQLKVSNEA